MPDTAYTAPKVAILGAGSYGFTTGLLYDLLIEYRLDHLHLAFMDVDVEMAEVMAGIARRIAAQNGLHLETSATGDRTEALAGADFVTTSVAVQLLKRWEMDKAVIHRYGIREPVSECGGVGGMSYAMRQVPLLLGIARDMERLCPNAWLLNTSNPLPRLITAVTRHTSIRTVGFCNVAWGWSDGYASVERLIGRNRHDINVVSAGTNHFSWLLSVRDRWTGEDLMPLVNAALATDTNPWNVYAVKLWRDYGVYPLSGDTHIGEYLPFDADYLTEHTAHHGTVAERAARRQALRDAAAGTLAWEAVMSRPWEHPGQVIAAMVTGIQRHLDMVNIPNRGTISGLPDDAVVEVPAIVANGTVTGVPLGPLPEPLAGLIAQVSAVHTLVADAAATGDRRLLSEAIQRDPAITEKSAAEQAITALLEIHADLLPQYA